MSRPLLALLGNITVRQFCVNNVKVSSQIFHLVENLTGICECNLTLLKNSLT